MYTDIRSWVALVSNKHMYRNISKVWAGWVYFKHKDIRR